MDKIIVTAPTLFCLVQLSLHSLNKRQLVLSMLQRGIFTTQSSCYKHLILIEQNGLIEELRITSKGQEIMRKYLL